MTLTTTIAVYAANPTAHKVAAQRGPALREALLCNQHVAEDLWCELYTVKGAGKVSAKTAKEAVSGALSAGRFQHVLAHETRASIVQRMLDRVYPSAELLADPTFTRHLADEKVADRMHRTYGPVLDADQFADLPVDTLAAPLRVWRLTSTRLTDAEVLAELRSFESWGSGFLQRPIGWVLHTRPQLLPDLIGTVGVSVITQAAGSAHLGTLSAPDQLRLLAADGNAAACTQDQADKHLYAWMAAASNPTLSMDALDAIEAHMDKADGDFNTSSVAANRRKYRPWSVASLREEVDGDKMAGLVRWAAPRAGKCRVGAIGELIENPSFYADEADVVAGSIAMQFDNGSALDTVLSGAPGRDVISRLVAEFPEVETCYQLTERHRDALVIRVGEAEARRLGAPVDVVDDGVTDAESAPESRPRAVNAETTRLNWNLTEPAVRWMDDQIGDDAATWEMAFTMVDTLTDLTLAEFVDTCRSLTL